MERTQLIDLIATLEARQDEESFVAAKEALEAALAEGDEAELLRDYGYIHECAGRASIREAVRLYERAVELEPRLEKAHHQLISAYAGLQQTRDAVDLYERRLAAEPEDLVWHRCLAHAYIAAGDFEKAAEVVERGLGRAPDVRLLEQRGEVLAGRGEFEEALAAWSRVLELDGENQISAHYSRAFLLERLGRLEEAAAEWQAIVDWNLARGAEIEAEWPRNELARLRAALGR